MKVTLALLVFAVLAACTFVMVGDGRPRQHVTGATNPSCVVGCEATGTVQSSASGASR